MTKIIDLDELLGEDKRVRLAGKNYTLPPDLPAELYLEINGFAAQDKTEAEMFGNLYEKVLGLFRYKQPDLESVPISLGQLVSVIGTVYGSGDEPDAVPPPKAGTTSTPRRKTPTKSRRST